MQTAFMSSVPVLRALPSSSVTSNAFLGARPNVVRSAPAAVNMKIVLPVFTEAMADFKAEYPEFAKKGWGCTVKAERWNGRHAMFGLLALVVTGYCKQHGLLPDADPLDLSVWGPLAATGDYTGISNQRAVILLGHVHLLILSVAAAMAPLSFSDKLLLDDGEADEEPAGLFPPFAPGLNKDAELWNGRVAMLGVVSLVVVSASTASNPLDVLNAGLGNLLF